MNPKKMWMALLALTLAMGMMTGCGKESEKSGSAKKPEAVKKPEKPEKKLPPLHAAVVKNDLEAIKALLEKGTDIDAKDEDGNTALHIAADKNNVEAAKILLGKGARQRKDAKGDYPLHIAAAKNSLAVAELLLKNGAKVKARNKYGDTPLHCAAQKNSAAVAELLLKNGAECNATDEMGATPFRFAFGLNHFETVDILLAHGAKVDAQSGIKEIERAIAKRNYALLKYVAKKGGFRWGYHSVFEYYGGKDFYQGDEFIFFKAIASNDVETVKILIPWLISLKKKEDGGLYGFLNEGTPVYAALIIAAGNGNIEICRSLIQFFNLDKKRINVVLPMARYNKDLCPTSSISYKGKDINNYAVFCNWYSNEKYGNVAGNPYYMFTPLTAALENGHWDCAKYLVSAGADVNQCLYLISTDTKRGRVEDVRKTFLYYAVINNNVKLVKELLAKGAKPQQELVKLTDNEDIIEMLDGAE